jgi:hypothetical protein
MIGCVFVAAWTWPKTLDTKLFHHVLVVLIGGEVNRRSG